LRYWPAMPGVGRLRRSSDRVRGGIDAGSASGAVAAGGPVAPRRRRIVLARPSGSGCSGSGIHGAATASGGGIGGSASGGGDGGTSLGGDEARSASGSNGATPPGADGGNPPGSNGGTPLRGDHGRSALGGGHGWDPS